MPVSLQECGAHLRMNLDCLTEKCMALKINGGEEAHVWMLVPVVPDCEDRF